MSRQTHRGGWHPGGARGIYFGWYLLAGAALMNGLGGSLLWQGFTVFFIPVSEGLNLSAWQTSLAFSLARAENGVLGPITGWALDRYGYRILMFAGTLVTGIGYLLLSLTDAYLEFMAIYLGVVSVGSSTSFMQATTAALNNWFVRLRGLVMSINSAAFRLGGAAMIPLLSYAVLTWGWEVAAAVVGAGMIIVILPLTLLFRRSPESMGLNPDGAPSRRRSRALGGARSLASAPRPAAGASESHASASDDADADPVARSTGERRTGRATSASAAAGTDAAAAIAPETHAGESDGAEDADADDWDTRRALRSAQFWVLVSATTLRIAVHGTIFVHFIPIMVSLGEEQQTAANLLGLLSLVAVPLIIFTGYVSDKVGRPVMLTGLYSMAALSLLALTVAEGTLPVFLALLLFSGSEAGSSLNWAIVGDLFGRRRYASIRGMMAPVYNGALIVAPVSAGWIFDQTDSYRLVLYIGTGLMFGAALVFLTLQPIVRRRAAE